jgi:hypothetical protein
LDKNDNVVFDARSYEGKYRAFKHSLYSEVTQNVSVSTLNIFNTIPKDNLSESSYRKIDLDDTVEWINSLDFTANTFVTDYIFDKEDEIKLYLVNRAGKIYILNYKDKNVSDINRIFNIDLPVGQYALFIKVNDKLYNTNKVYRF